MVAQAALLRDQAGEHERTARGRAARGHALGRLRRFWQTRGVAKAKTTSKKNAKRAPSAARAAQPAKAAGAKKTATPHTGARGGRFAKALDPVAAALNASIGFDRRLLAVDVAGSRAHAAMLAKQGLLSKADAKAIDGGLQAVHAEFAAGKATFRDDLEDIHMNVEARLAERIGDAGRRLHSGRSRNDQVATDLRLWSLVAGGRLLSRVRELRVALLEQAEAEVDTFMPGYTHLQRAQPVRVAHHLLAYDAMLARDAGRLADALLRANVSPLGSGALAGTTLPIDRAATAAQLGFTSLSRNSLDAVGDRDFAIELVAAAALCQVHLSRLGEELVLWVSQEFGFVSIGEAYCSGSSLMPQKMNPDIAELIRGKAGRVIGDWVTLMTVVKGLPLAYNKDLQETQEPLYDAVETVDAALTVTTGMVRSLVFHRDVLRAAVDRGHLVATEVADYLVDKGVAFRDAHDAAGTLVRHALAAGCELAALPLSVYREVHPRFGKDVYAWLKVERAVDRRDLIGGPARKQVAAELRRVKKELGL